MSRHLFVFIVLSTIGQFAAAQGSTVPVLAGGVSIEARNELRAVERKYNLKLVFTLLEGNYVTDITVKIADRGGRVVVDERVQGPIMLARLPAGSYTATLIRDGVTQTRQLALGAARLHTLQVRWQRGVDDTPLTLR